MGWLQHELDLFQENFDSDSVVVLRECILAVGFNPYQDKVHTELEKLRTSGQTGVIEQIEALQERLKSVGTAE